MTLKERLAAKKAAEQAPAVEPNKNGLKLTGSSPMADMPSGGIAATPMAEGRQLGYTESGEHAPMKHEAEGLSPEWSHLCHSFETELCVVIGPGHKDVCWLAVKAENQTVPLLIHKLPLCILPRAFEPF